MFSSVNRNSYENRSTFDAKSYKRYIFRTGNLGLRATVVRYRKKLPAHAANQIGGMPRVPPAHAANQIARMTTIPPAQDK